MAVIVLPSGNWVVAGRHPQPGFLREPPPVAARAGAVQFYVHHTGVHPGVAAAAPVGTVWVDVSSSDTAYFESLSRIWEQRESFATLEHDIICRSDIVEAFESCPEPWCTYGYAEMCHPECREAWANALGCTRFRAELMVKVPEAVSSIPPGPLTDWHNVCDGLGGSLRAAGFTHHWHEPHVRHPHWA